MPREDMELGPCAVYFGAEGAEVDLGRTEGGVRVAFTTDVGDLSSDQWGTQPEDGVFTGQGVTVTVPLAEYTLDNLAIALNMTVIGDALIEGERLVGTKLSDIAQSLLLREYVDGAVSMDAENAMRFPVAAPVGSPEILFSKSDQRIIEVEFKCFPDSNDILYYIGDESAS
jgi:hypothetical protein